MKKTVLAGILASSTVMPVWAADPAWTLTGNAALVSDYRFRGFSQTNLKPAVQAGFDLTHQSGFYLGNWNSNVASELFSGGNLEMDAYGGYAWSSQGFDFDVGTLYYYYPGSKMNGSTIDNLELYGSVGYGPFTLKYSHGVTDFFGVPDSKNNYYLDLSAAFDLGQGWTGSAHVGYQKLKNDPDISGYVDYALGVSKDIQGWELGLTLVSTSQKDWVVTPRGKNAGRFGAVLGLSKSF